MRLKFIVSGKETETYSPADKTVAELVEAVLLSTGNTGSDVPWECRNLEGSLLDNEKLIGYYIEEGEIGELRGTLILKPKVEAVAGWAS